MGRPKGSKNKRPYIRTRGSYGVPPAHKAILTVFSKLGIEVSSKQASLLRVGWRNHRGRAETYGIPFLLSFEQWLRIWHESGHLFERGSRKHQYVMARHGDSGPYAIGNVKIIPVEENMSEAWSRPEYCQRVNARLYGNTWVRGSVWITNGEQHKRILPATPLPKGWWRGRGVSYGC